MCEISTGPLKPIGPLGTTPGTPRTTREHSRLTLTHLALTHLMLRHRVPHYVAPDWPLPADWPTGDWRSEPPLRLAPPPPVVAGAAPAAARDLLPRRRSRASAAQNLRSPGRSIEGAIISDAAREGCAECGALIGSGGSAGGDIRAITADGIAGQISRGLSRVACVAQRLRASRQICAQCFPPGWALPSTQRRFLASSNVHLERGRPSGHLFRQRRRGPLLRRRPSPAGAAEIRSPIITPSTATPAEARITATLVISDSPFSIPSELRRCRAVAGIEFRIQEHAARFKTRRWLVDPGIRVSCICVYCICVAGVSGGCATPIPKKERRFGAVRQCAREFLRKIGTARRFRFRWGSRRHRNRPHGGNRISHSGIFRRRRKIPRYSWPTARPRDPARSRRPAAAQQAQRARHRDVFPQWRRSRNRWRGLGRSHRRLRRSCHRCARRSREWRTRKDRARRD